VKSPRETREILDKLEPQHPGADTELHFKTPFELLTATILSAQSTDAMVNTVTPALFRKYPNAKALARATTAQLEPQIHSTGFFRAKSKSLIGMAQALVEHHGGEVPNTMAALVELPGVGRKTAACVLMFSFGRPEIPVDTHVYRVGTRLGLFRPGAPLDEAHDELLRLVDPEDAYEIHVSLIRHGRRTCSARNPRCHECPLLSLCPYGKALTGRARTP
jgi:endonuclease III